MGRDDCDYVVHVLNGGFNPRARVGRDVSILTWIGILICFNPRARVGRDSHDYIPITLLRAFQSTRPRGARHAEFGDSFPYPVGFNPRARVGRDASIRNARTTLGRVSIHAPAWGATARVLSTRALLSLPGVFREPLLCNSAVLVSPSCVAD